MEEKQKEQKEMRADAPKSTVYNLTECFTPDGRRVWYLNLTTPNQTLIDNIMSHLSTLSQFNML